MENRAHALIAGIFVLLFGAACAAALWWLGNDGDQVNRYRLETRGSVTGLNVQAQVRYRGIRAGKVESIDLSPTDPRMVQVIIVLDRRFVLTKSSKVRLGSQGVTGLAHVQIDDDGSTPEPLPSVAGELPVLELRSGGMDTLTERAGEIMNQVGVLTKRLDLVFSEQNLKNISRTIDNVADSSAALRELPQIMASVREAVSPGNLQRLQAMLAKLDTTLGEAAPLARDLRTLVQSMAQLSQQSEKLVRSAAQTGDQLGASTLPEVQLALRELRATSRQLAGVLERLDRDPQMLLLGTQSAQPGPGETGFVAPVRK
jgi:phospholipid/cholesterol/gamma-HCH transport system substrate-binding protein